MAEFVNEAQAQVNEAHNSAYSGYTLQSELLLSGMVKMVEVSTVHAGFRTDLTKRIVDNVYEIRSNQNTQESTLLDQQATLLDIQEILKMILEQQQKTNTLLESLLEGQVHK